MSRESLTFGEGSFMTALKDVEFHQLTAQDQAKIVGWANGCPVVDELTDPNNRQPGRGPERMLQRYGEVNFWFGYVADAVKERNPDLYAQLITPTPRAAHEAVGPFEPQSVPASYETEMAPMGTIAGYSLPRIFTKQLGEDMPIREKQNRLWRGIDVLDAVIPEAETPEQLLALVAEDLSQADVDPVVALSATLSTGWFNEHNARGLLDVAKQAFAAKAPRLWALYGQLSAEDKARYNIA